MKKFFYKIVLFIAFIMLFPTVITLLIQGSGKKSIGKLAENTSLEGQQELDEDMLIGIVANEVNVTVHPEAMKAQAVIVRTNCLRALEKDENLPEGLTKSEMMRLWGSENFTEHYAQLESAISDTKGVAMTYQGEYIQADFHAVSAGYTRNAQEIYQNEEFPYLKSVECRKDIPAQNFLKVMFYTPEEFLSHAGKFFTEDMTGKTAGELLTAFYVLKRDSAGYVTEVQANQAVFLGEEVRLAFDWNSSCFALKEIDGEIRVVTKGYGHGLGLSLYGADRLAENGYGYKDILKHFYTDIEFVTCP